MREATASNQLQEHDVFLAKISQRKSVRGISWPASREYELPTPTASTTGILPVGDSPLPLQTLFHDASAAPISNQNTAISALVAKHKPDSFSSSISNVSSSSAVFVTASKRISQSMACSTASSPHDGGCDEIRSGAATTIRRLS
jgi:hypothetical protein